jgi:nucleoside-diphosphate-sugar epimerase
MVSGLSFIISETRYLRQAINLVLRSYDVITDSAKYLELIKSASIDIVVDVTGARAESKHILEDLKRAGKERLERADLAGVRSPKIGFIYCSGTWVHGDPKVPVNDLSPVGVQHAPAQPSEMVAWRPKVEKEVLAASDVLDTMVVRPALVYGRAGAIWGAFFSPILVAIQNDAKEVSLAANTESRPSLIHVDDVSSGFEAAINKLPAISGTGVYPVFDLVTSQESLRDILLLAARSLGFNGRVDLTGPGEDLFMQAMNSSVYTSSSRAVELLGWKPRRIGMIQSIDIFAKGWLAHQT